MTYLRSMSSKQGVEWGRTLRIWIVAGQRRLAEERGASVVEYAMLVLFIAVVAIGAVSMVGPPLNEGLAAGGSGFAP